MISAPDIRSNRSATRICLAFLALIAIFAVVGALHSHAAAAGTGGHWRFDRLSGSDATDSAGTSNHGTVVGDVTRVAGLTCGALRFSGDGHVALPGQALDGAADVAVSFWFRTEKSGQQALISGANQGNTNEFLVFLRSHTQVDVYTGESSSSRAAFTVPSVADGEWHHLGVLRSATDNRIRLFLDGSEQSTSTADIAVDALSISANGLLIGQEQDAVGGGFDSGQAFVGDMDDVRITSGVTSDSEILSAYSQGQSASATDRDGHWSFDDGSGLLAADSTDGQDATLCNGPRWDTVPGSLKFDGADDYLSVKNASSFSGLQDFTVMFEYWTRARTSGSFAIVSAANEANDNELLIMLNVRGTAFHGLQVMLDSPTTTYQRFGRYDGRPHHVAVVRERHWLKIYVDGRVVSQRIPVSHEQLQIADGGLIIGQEQDSVGGGFQARQAFNGVLNDVRIVPEALGIGEIRQIANGLD